MKKLFLLIFCFLVSPVLAQNAMPFCTAMTTRVHVRTHPGNPQYITQYSKEDFLKKTNSTLSPYTLGLTVSKLDVILNTKPQINELLGQICVSLDDVDIEMTYPSMTVYIDKKYQPSSCEYKTIKEHENYHVAVAQQALTFFRPDIEKAAMQAISKLAPKIVYSQTEVAPVVEKFHRAINNALQPVVTHINKKLAEKNAAIDTPQMYQETTAVCDNW